MNAYRNIIFAPSGRCLNFKGSETKLFVYAFLTENNWNNVFGWPNFAPHAAWKQYLNPVNESILSLLNQLRIKQFTETKTYFADN